jgi:uncharacterized protein YjbI with pentapeptide repeats
VTDVQGAAVEVPHDWDECEFPGCHGARIAGMQCLRHGDPEVVAQVVSQSNSVDLRGVEVDQPLFDRLVSHPTGTSGSKRYIDRVLLTHAVLAEIRFRSLYVAMLDLRGALFTGQATFTDVEFVRTVLLDATRFEQGVSVSNAKFDGGLVAGQCEWGDALFRDTDLGVARIFKATGGLLSFQDVRAVLIELTNAQFGEALGIQGSDLQQLALTKVSTNGAVITDCQIGPAEIKGLVTVQELKIDRCNFEGSCLLGLTAQGTGLWLSNSRFKARPSVSLACFGAVDLRGNQFLEGAAIQIYRGQVALDNSDFRRPSILSRSEPPPPGLPVTFRTIGRVVSLRQTDLVNLTIDDISLANCRFAGAHNLDKLRFNGASLFRDAPAGFAWNRWPWRLTRRVVLLEEAEWRHRCRRPWSSRWEPIEWPREFGPSEHLDPPEIADLYRRLRKAREDEKDEPGAADFYYGEMEMRRLASDTPRGERLILTAYWALSGYGLRSSRALSALAVLTAGLSFALWRFGFATVDHHRPGYWRALTYSLGAATLHPPTRHLTTLGEALAIGFRVAGPVLLGLALVSIRGRVRR